MTDSPLRPLELICPPLPEHECEIAIVEDLARGDFTASAQVWPKQGGRQAVEHIAMPDRFDTAKQAEYTAVMRVKERFG